MSKPRGHRWRMDGGEQEVVGAGALATGRPGPPPEERPERQWASKTRPQAVETKRRTQQNAKEIDIKQA